MAPFISRLINQIFSFFSLIITSIVLLFGFQHAPIATHISAEQDASQNSQSVSSTLVPTQSTIDDLPTTIYYTVEQGDTLESIALRYNVSWIDLANYNQITNPNSLAIGQIITIPTARLAKLVKGESGYAEGGFDPYYQTTIYQAAPGEKHILVVLTEQKLYTYEGESLVDEYLISSGVAEHPTVTGIYKVWIKLESTLMQGEGYYLPDVPYTMYFYGDYGIHGTYWHDNFGTPMSHGCINMRTEDAETVFNWVEVGTIVQVIP